MSIADQKLAKVREILKLADESLTRDEFTDAFKKILDHLFKLEAKLVERLNTRTQEEKNKLSALQTDFNNTIDEFKKVVEDARTESDSTFSGFKRRTMEAISQLFARNEVNKKLNERIGEVNSAIIDIENEISRATERIEGKLKEVDERMAMVRSGEDGKDADEEKIAKSVLDKIEEKQFKMDDIKGLKQELEDLRNIRTRVKGGGTSAIGVAQTFKWIAHTEQPSGAIDGANTDYTVQNNIWWIAGFTLNGEQIAELPNFTYVGKTITFASAIPAAYSGKDFEVKYIGT